MDSTAKTISTRGTWILGAIAIASLALQSTAAAQPQQPAAQTTAAKQVVGPIKSIAGSTVTITTDAGADVTVTVPNDARIVRVAPGQTDLKTATPIQPADLQVGDRILVRGKLADDAKSLIALGVIAMKRTDVDAKQAHDREDWDKRGIGGLVSAVDAGTGSITISVAAPGGNKAITVHTTKETILRRYAPDSVQFDDAKSSNLNQVKAGDQLRARGTRSADGTEFAAEEIVSGAFRNIAGTINSADPAANTLSVRDLITKKTVLVKVSAQSQVVKLPPQAAQAVAAHLKGAAPGGGAGGQGAAGAAGGPGGQNGGTGQRAGGARAAGAQADLQQVVNRLPHATLADFQKGDAVMIVSTEGTESGGVTAITLLGGVEPLLAAAPSGGQAVTLAPWNLGGGGGDAGEAN